jgi:hypothetical protein
LRRVLGEVGLDERKEKEKKKRVKPPKTHLPYSEPQGTEVPTQLPQ